MSRFHLFVCSLALTAALSQIAISGRAAEPPAWRGPAAVEWIDARRVAVLEADSRRLTIVDVDSGEETAAIDLPARPGSMTLARQATPDGEVRRRFFIACGGANGRVIEVEGLDAVPPAPRIVRTIDVGHTPTGLAVNPDRTRLYVCNRFDGDVSIVDLETGETRNRWPVLREPMDLALTPDGQALFVANHLSTERADQYSIAAAVSVIDTTSGHRKDIRLPNGANGLRDIEISPCGRVAYVTHVEANFLAIPFQVTGGWINRNALSVIDVERRRFGVTILLDDYSLGAGNPWIVRCSPDGAWVAVSHAGTDEISLIDAERLRDRIGDYIADIKNSPSGVVLAPSFLRPYRQRIRLPIKGPRGLAIDNDRIVAAGYFSDELACLPIEANAVAAQGTHTVGSSYGGTASSEQAEGRGLESIPLGQPPQMTAVRRGEMLFSDATLCFEMWQSCTSCHPDGRSDSINWDLLNDGAGNPKNSKSMVLAHRTPPSMSMGVRATAEVAVRAGFHHILFCEPSEEDAAAVDAYLRSLEPVPSPRLVEGRLSPSALRGKRLFLSPRIGCASCHPAPLFTDRKLHTVEAGEYDISGERFDTPTLIEVWRTAPYWHDGRYTTIQELLFEGGHGNQGGRLDRLSPQDKADLVEYVLSL